MSNPFKVGDKVKGNDSWQTASRVAGKVWTVLYVRDVHVHVDDVLDVWHYDNLVAAVAGIDYPATKRDDNLPLGVAPNSGHLSDGSSIQKHSAGGLYPVVVWHRDKKLPGVGKYDVGLTWPDQADTVWFRDYASAINVAEAIKESF